MMACSSAISFSLLGIVFLTAGAVRLVSKFIKR